MAFIPQGTVQRPQARPVRTYITRDAILSDLADMAAKLGESRLGEGREVVARDLFKDSARKYAHISTDERNQAAPILAKALRSAEKANDPAVSFEIAMGYSKVLNMGTYAPSLALADEVMQESRIVENVRKVLERVTDSSCIYFYRISMSPDEFQRILETSANTRLGNALAQSRDKIVYIRDSNDEEGIVMSYSASGTGSFSIRSRHLREEHDDRKTLINAVCSAMELFIRS